MTRSEQNRENEERDTGLGGFPATLLKREEIGGSR